jgi:hypothetical protein
MLDEVSKNVEKHLKQQMGFSSPSHKIHSIGFRVDLLNFSSHIWHDIDFFFVEKKVL